MKETDLKEIIKSQEVNDLLTTYSHNIDKLQEAGLLIFTAQKEEEYSISAIYYDKLFYRLCLSISLAVKLIKILNPDINSDEPEEVLYKALLMGKISNYDKWISAYNLGIELQNSILNSSYEKTLAITIIYEYIGIFVQFMVEMQSVILDIDSSHELVCE